MKVLDTSNGALVRFLKVWNKESFKGRETR